MPQDEHLEIPGDATLQIAVAEALACRACASEFASTHTGHSPRPVLRPSSTARICIAGQAPGLRVHESGTPFDDPSGERLRDWMGVDRQIFYDESRIAIVPMAFCFPGYDAKGGDLPPPKRCASLWRARLFELQPQIELMILVGQYAQAWHLGPRRAKTLTETVRNWRSYWESDARPRLFPTPHPSWRNNTWLKKNPWFEGEALPVLRAAIAQRL
ncbi:MAG: uracil-DNA glycosylase family protein [Pseudomonadota bacterium]